MVYYPDIMSKWADKITFGDITKPLQKATEIIISALFDNPDITKDEMKNKLPADTVNYLACDFEILDHTLKTPKEINEQMQEYFTTLEIKNLEREIKETATELAPYLSNPPQNLWEKYCALQEQKQELIKKLYG